MHIKAVEVEKLMLGICKSNSSEPFDEFAYMMEQEQPRVFGNMLQVFDRPLLNGFFTCYELLRRAREKNGLIPVRLSKVDFWESVQLYKTIDGETLARWIDEEEPELMIVPRSLYEAAETDMDRDIIRDIIKGFYFCWWLFGRHADTIRLN